MTTIDTGQTTRVAETAESLRALADFIEANPTIGDRVASAAANDYGGGIFNIWAENAEQMAHLAHQLGGHREKRADDSYVDIVRRFGPLRIRVTAPRERVCERRVVGTHTVEVPATEAQPAQPARTIEVERIEWECPPILGGAA